MLNSKTPARRVKSGRVGIARIVARAATVVGIVDPVVMAVAVAVIVTGAHVVTVAVIALPVVTVHRAAMAAVVPQSRTMTMAPHPNSPPPSSRATATKHKVLERTNEKGLPKGGPFFLAWWAEWWLWAQRARNARRSK